MSPPVQLYSYDMTMNMTYDAMTFDGAPSARQQAVGNEEYSSTDYWYQQK